VCHLTEASRQPRLREQDLAALLRDGQHPTGLDRRQQAEANDANGRVQDGPVPRRKSRHLVLRDTSKAARRGSVRPEQCAERERDRQVSAQEVNSRRGEWEQQQQQQQQI